jgi:tetratricopeptide (TPR) repeat protein
MVRPANIVFLIALFLGGWRALLSAQEEPPADGIEGVIERLASEHYAEREAASRQLWELGKRAMPALREAVKSRNPEVGQRSRKLLDKLELGIFPETPLEEVALIEEFHAGGKDVRIKVLQGLRGPSELTLRIRLMLSERDLAQRAEFIKMFAGTGDVLLAELARSGQQALASELLAAISAREWAVWVMLEGNLEQELARLQGQREAGQEGTRSDLLAWLMILTGDLKGAREVAEERKDEALQREVYQRERDWKALAALENGVPCDNDVERLGFKAMILMKAGAAAGAKEAIAELAHMEVVGDSMNRNCAASLILLDRPDLAAERFETQEKADRYELDYHLQRLDFKRLFKRFGMTEAEEDFTGKVEERIATALREGDHRELFFDHRSLGKVLLRIGKQEQARMLLVASQKLIESEPRYLSILAGDLRSAGFVKEARVVGLAALKAGEGSAYLSALFGGRREVMTLWWEFFRARERDDSIEETLQRMTELFALLEGGDETALAKGEMLAAVAKWVESLEEGKRAAHHGALAKIYLEQGDSKAAMGHYRNQAKAESRPGPALIEAGNLLACSERWQEAAKLYAEAAATELKAEVAVYLQGHALVQSGDVRGEKLMAAALRMPLANSDRRNYLAIRLSREGFEEAAQEAWEFIILTAPHATWTGRESWALRNASLQLGGELAKSDPGRAADFLERYVFSFLKTNTSMTPHYYLIHKARLHVLRSEECLAEGNLEGAIAFLRKAIVLRPGSVDLVVDAMEVLGDAGRADVAEELFEALEIRYRSALKLVPNSSNEHNNLAWLFARSGRKLDEALELAGKAVELSPKQHKYLDTLAEVNFRLENREKAVEVAKEGLNISPEDEHLKAQLKRFESEGTKE